MLHNRFLQDVSTLTTRASSVPTETILVVLLTLTLDRRMNYFFLSYLKVRVTVVNDHCAILLPLKLRRLQHLRLQLLLQR